MIGGVIFDLDGLLIDSEPLWRKAERKVFSKVGIILEDGDFEHFTGYKISEVVSFWYGHKPCSGPTQPEIETEILDELIRLIQTEGKPKPGVVEILAFFEQKKLPMVVASSSPSRVIRAAVEKMGISHYFKALYSAEFEKYGKPHPAVFVTAIEGLGLSPKDCLIFEDSFNGLIAAKAARAKTVSVPENNLFEQARFDIADIKLYSLLEFGQEQWLKLNS